MALIGIQNIQCRERLKNVAIKIGDDVIDKNSISTSPFNSVNWKVNTYTHTHTYSVLSRVWALRAVASMNGILFPYRSLSWCIPQVLCLKCYIVSWTFITDSYTGWSVEKAFPIYATNPSLGFHFLVNIYRNVQHECFGIRERSVVWWVYVYVSVCQCASV